MDSEFFTYILCCSDGTLYTGYARNMEERLEKHNQGKASKYTRSRLPVQVVYWEPFKTKSEAMARECYIKRLSRAKKQALIKGGEQCE